MTAEYDLPGEDFVGEDDGTITQERLGEIVDHKLDRYRFSDHDRAVYRRQLMIAGEAHIEAGDRTRAVFEALYRLPLVIEDAGQPPSVWGELTGQAGMNPRVKK